MALTRAEIEAPLAEHLRMARWLLVYQGPDRYELIRSLEPNGQAAAELFASSGCSDVIVGHAGPAALDLLATSRIQVWQGELGVPARELAKRLERGELAVLQPAPPDRSGGRGVGGRAR